MSTKHLRALVETARQAAQNHTMKAEALAAINAAGAELEAIERAAKGLDRLAIGDGVYDVRDRAKTLHETPEGHDTWGHPDVKAWGDAATLMASIAKEET